MSAWHRSVRNSESVMQLPLHLQARIWTMLVVAGMFRHHGKMKEAVVAAGVITQVHHGVNNGEAAMEVEGMMVIGMNDLVEPEGETGVKEEVIDLEEQEVETGVEEGIDMVVAIEEVAIEGAETEEVEIEEVDMVVEETEGDHTVVEETEGDHMVVEEIEEVDMVEEEIEEVDMVEEVAVTDMVEEEIEEVTDKVEETEEVTGPGEEETGTGKVETEVLHGLEVDGGTCHEYEPDQRTNWKQAVTVK